MMYSIDWQRYWELGSKEKEEMTEEEWEFFKWMYHVEEHQQGWIEINARC